MPVSIEALIACPIYRLAEGLQFVRIVSTQAGKVILGNLLLSSQFIQAGEGRTRRHQVCLRVFAFQHAVLLEAEQPDDGSQAQPLPD
jgi:hypothetical protein